MTRAEKASYFQAIRERYWKARRGEKKRILDEFCTVCGYNRKYAIRRLRERRVSGSRGKPGKVIWVCARSGISLSASRHLDVGSIPLREAPKG